MLPGVTVFLLDVMNLMLFELKWHREFDLPVKEVSSYVVQVLIHTIVIPVQDFLQAATDTAGQQGNVILVICG